MKQKRIQIIHRTNDGKCRKFWHQIDSNRMITLEHVWKDLNRDYISFSNIQYKFFYHQTERMLPAWYHIDRLKDGDQILVDVKSVSVPATTPISSSIKVKKVWNNQSKQKQMKSFVTNRSFVITNKNSIPNAFYQRWEEGKTHQSTNNCRMIF